MVRGEREGKDREKEMDLKWEESDNRTEGWESKGKG